MFFLRLKPTNKGHPLDTFMPFQVAVMFQKLVSEDGLLEVTEISEKQETKSRPVGLNTVNLLKVKNHTEKITFYTINNGYI